MYFDLGALRVTKMNSINELIAERIREYRKLRKYSLKKVAEYLGVQYQQIQKYERGETRVPAWVLVKLAELFNVSVDTLIFGIEEQNEAAGLIEKVPKFRGTTLNPEKLINMILFFAITCRLNKTKLNKLLFYADFLHYKEHGKPISNVPYVKLPHGPAPESYNAILGILEGTGHIEITEVVLNKGKGVIEEQITAVRPFDQKLFDEKELEILRKVALHLGGKTGAELSELAHNEPFWEEHGLGKPIDYELAKKLKVEL